METPRFVPMHIYSHDEHYGVDRPAAAIVRLDKSLEEKVAQALQLIQRGDFMSVSIPLGEDNVRWIRTVGYTSENGLAPVLGARPTDPHWMPAGADLHLADNKDVMELDTDGKEADFREDCVVYESSSEPLLGVSCLELMRFNSTGPGVRADSPICYTINGETENYKANGFVYAAKLLWPDLITEEDTDRLRERQTA